MNEVEESIPYVALCLWVKR